MSEEAVRAAFKAQAGHCERLGSPFTALLCQVMAASLDGTTAVGHRMLAWPGVPDASGDSVPLRLAGALHALVRRGRLPTLAALYPPHPLPEPAVLRRALAEALRDAEPEIDAWLDSAPQTNEVARSSLLIAALAVVAHETGHPVALLELGASAGLNLMLERYAHDLGGRSFGTAGAALALAPPWQGEAPPAADVVVHARRGIDLNPLDVTAPADRERLVAYVWPDQSERLARIAAAITIARADPPGLDRGDAADWLEARLSEPPVSGVARVVQHSIAFQYFPANTQARIAAAMAAAGAEADVATPLAWSRFEVEPGAGSATLRLRLWPGGEDRLLARADPHVREVTWL